jgi:hypothetical protein
MTEKQCQMPAFFRYTWPGRDENFVCSDHATKLLQIAQAMGLYLQLFPLAYDDLFEKQCEQMIEEK